MSETKTIEQKLYSRKIKRPGFLYNVVGNAAKLVCFKKYNVHTTFHFDKKLLKSSHIFVSNHTSRIDYFFNAMPLLPVRYNFVVGYNEFYRSQFAGLFKLMNCIPKKNFVPDYYAMKEISRVLKNNGNIFIFPEGMNSISGANQPVTVGTGKMLKHFCRPVFGSVIKGGYLTVPKHAQDERPGYVEVDYYQLFTREELEKLSPDEIEDKLNDILYHDDPKWNYEYKHVYRTDGKAGESLHYLLFRCPKCGGEFTMLGKNDEIRCSVCGNGAKIDETYTMTPFNDQCVIPATQTDWFNSIRESIKQEVRQEGYSFSAEVELGELPKYDMLKGSDTSVKCGSGLLTVDKTGLTYDGTRNGEKFCFHIPSVNLPTYGMCTDLSRFYTFYQGQFMEFYPKTPCTEKFILATEEIHRMNGGKWQDFKFDK